MRIALISDIHGNEVALDAVIKDIQHIGVDQIICLGDVVTLGPQPVAALQLIRDLNCKCIMGNHDAFMLNPDLIHTYTEAPIIIEAVAWCRDQLSEEDFDFIRTFKKSIALESANQSPFLFFHGSPRNHMENILATTPSGALEQMLDGHNAVVMAGGHTHIQMLRQHKGNLIVNPGSVGFPFKEFVSGDQPELMEHPEYAIIETQNNRIDIALKRIQFDGKKFEKTIGKGQNPIRSLLQPQT